MDGLVSLWEAVLVTYYYSVSTQCYFSVAENSVNILCQFFQNIKYQGTVYALGED